MQIVCADNSPVTRMGISETLTKYGHPGASQADCFSSLIQLLQNQTFELLICELRFHDADLLESLDEVRHYASNVPILIYSLYNNPTFIARAATHRIYDYVLKSDPISALIQSVNTASTGIPPSNSLLLNAKQFLANPVKNGFSGAHVLTRRECQILSHLALGLSNREISASLEISVETAKEHVQNILRKLRSADRTHAAVWALRNGIPSLRIEN
jgi:DNA-binding NarL/FixJ family response regulator